MKPMVMATRIRTSAIQSVLFPPKESHQIRVSGSPTREGAEQQLGGSGELNFVSELFAD